MFNVAKLMLYLHFQFCDNQIFSKNINKMATGIPKKQVLLLYKSLIKEAESFSNYNFRAYALRRVRDAFKANKTLTDSKIIQNEYLRGKENLEIIKRQVVVGDMYRADKLVIEQTR